MLFIDKNDLTIENNGRRKDRKVICDICSTMGDKYYIHKITMDFNHLENVYSCPRCSNKVSGLDVEKHLYFNTKELIYEPQKAEREQTNIIEFAGLDEHDKAPEIEVTNLDSEPEEPQ